MVMEEEAGEEEAEGEDDRILAVTVVAAVIVSLTRCLQRNLRP